MKAKDVIAYIALGVTTCLAITFVILYAVEVSDDQVSVDKHCGGVLEGDSGKLQHEFTGGNEDSNCLWILRLAHGHGIRITVNRLTTPMMVYNEKRRDDGSLEPTL